MSQQRDDDQRAGRYSDLFGSHEGHGSDCAYCPICTGIGLVRSANPEILDHLAAAAREFMIAAGMFLEEAGGRVGKPDASDRPTDPGDGKVRRIDVG
ncbi:MAG: hypothetical protein KY391_04635 [Actinobacteria bacterium]|nr:hypothetical protein [Actinomycetota bacterium]